MKLDKKQYIHTIFMFSSNPYCQYYHDDDDDDDHELYFALPSFFLYILPKGIVYVFAFSFFVVKIGGFFLPSHVSDVID